MRKILVGFAVCGGLLHADSVTCTTGGNLPATSVSCNSLGVFNTAYSGSGPYVSFDVSGNTATANLNLMLQYSYSDEPNYSFWFGQAVQFADTLNLATKPGDTLRFSADFSAGSLVGGDSGNAQETLSVGPGNTVEPIVSLVAGVNGSPVYCEFHECTYSANLSAGSYSYLNLQGQAILNVQPCSTSSSSYCAPLGADVFDIITIQQFSPSGSPDPFAPEPSTCSLMIAALAVFLAGLLTRGAKDRITFYKVFRPYKSSALR